MKLFANKKLFKKIVILLVTITLVNALMPLHMVSADADEDFGGALFRPICQFMAGVGDLVISGLQWIFIGDLNIKTGEVPELNMATYSIRYSPGVIFSNKVAGLDANFINPGDPQKVRKLKEAEQIKNYSINDPYLMTIGFDKNKIMSNELEQRADRLWGFMKYGVDTVAIVYQWYDEKHNQNHILFKRFEDKNLVEDLGLASNLLLPINFGGVFKNKIEKILLASEGDEWTLYSFGNEIYEEEEEVKKSAADELQWIISKWYKALRMVSLVALLSVLVYVGIRIIIASTGQEKAKYKRMIGDWLVAICILFVLNYIMAFTMEVIEQITDFFATSSLIEENGVDRLITDIRNNINSNQYSGITSFTYLILYLTLVVYTVIFTIHYLKRLVYLAFFTMIAPLIAVTYPLDRIKDGQAQAFGTWIKEYTFNAAIPIIHIVIYSALVGSAADLAQSNPLYSIVCISFLIPGEKFFRKLFGFDKATTSSQLGAAAGGAVIMNAINKMGAKSGKQAAEKAGASSMPRTNGSGYIAPPGGAGAPGGAGTPSGAGAPGGAGAPSGAGAPGGAGAPSGAGAPTANVFGQTVNMHHTKPKGVKGGNIAGWKGVAGRYFNKNTAKKVGRLARKATVGALGATVGTTAGLVAGISTGDFSNTLKYSAIGAGAGFSGANYATDKTISGVTSFVKDNKDTFVENKWGTDEYNTRKQVKELSNDQEFNKTCKSLGISGKGKEEAIRSFNNNGITDPDDIKKAMAVQARTGVSQPEIIAAQKIRQQAQKEGKKRKDIIDGLKSDGVDNIQIARAMSLIDML